MSDVDIVPLLEERVNAGDVDGVMELFDPGAIVTIPALSTRRGHDEIRGLFEFCAGIGLRWECHDAIESEGGVTCRVDQYDGWAELIGVAPLRYERFDIGLEDGRIASLRGQWSQKTIEQLGKSLEGFTPWATEHHPELYGPDGDFNYTRRAGAGFIDAAAEWLGT